MASNAIEMLPNVVEMVSNVIELLSNVVEMTLHVVEMTLQPSLPVSRVMHKTSRINQNDDNKNLTPKHHIPSPMMYVARGETIIINLDMENN